MYGQTNGTAPYAAVGDIVITSTRDNPAGRYGGGWSEIDREFKSINPKSYNEAVTVNTTNANDFKIYVGHQGHVLFFEMQLNSKVTLGDANTHVATIDVTQLGISQFPDTIYTSQFSDTGECLVEYRIQSNGYVEVIEVWSLATSTHSLPPTNLNWHELVIPIPKDYILDDPNFCNKYYWERNA